MQTTAEGTLVVSKTKRGGRLKFHGEKERKKPFFLLDRKKKPACGKEMSRGEVAEKSIMKGGEDSSTKKVHSSAHTGSFRSEKCTKQGQEGAVKHSAYRSGEGAGKRKAYNVDKMRWGLQVRAISDTPRKKNEEPPEPKGMEQSLKKDAETQEG